MFKGLIEYLNKGISEYGVVKAVRKFIKKCNTEIEVKSNKEINNVLKKFSGVVVANHPSGADVFAILSAIKDRDDVFMIATSNLEKMISELDKHIIPVYISSREIKTIEGRIKDKIFDWFNKTPKYKREEERQKNIESINKAIEKINNGGLVIIFPNGGDEKHGWFNGIGHLIHGIKDKEKTFVIRAYIEGTSDWDYLRLLPLMGKFLPKFKISFANPLRVDKIKMDNPKTTTAELENKYWKWIYSVKMWTKLNKSYLYLRILFLFLITKY